MLLYIIGGFSVLFLAYIVYGYNKMQNVKKIPTSKRIKVLSNKNFKAVIRQKTVLVDFWAPWCAPCKTIAPTLNEIAEEQKDKIVIAKVNVDNNQQLAKKYKVRSIPTLILFQDGIELKRISGVKPKRALLKEIGLKVTIPQKIPIFIISELDIFIHF